MNELNAKFPLTLLSQLKDWASHSYRKYVYFFGEGGDGDVILFGKKGARLCEMSKMGLPIPIGFIISTDAFREIICSRKIQSLFESSIWKINPFNIFPSHFVDDYKRAVHQLEIESGRLFGDRSRFDLNFGKYCDARPNTLLRANSMPLLLAVRPATPSGISGMMDTLLNVGMNDSVVDLLTAATSNKWFALDTYQRFLLAFGVIVLGIDKIQFEKAKTKIVSDKPITESSVDELEAIVKEFKLIACNIPEDPWLQLTMAILAVFKSWYHVRVACYRDMQGITSDDGAAVIIQSMVFGNMNAKSGAGICFSRNPCNGENTLCGEYFPMCEGSNATEGDCKPADLNCLSSESYGTLKDYVALLENHFRNAVTTEFTIEDSKLFLLQTRKSNLSPSAWVKVAVDLVEEHVVHDREAIANFDTEVLTGFSHSNFSVVHGMDDNLIATGFGASAGCITGKLAFDISTAQLMARDGENIILCCRFASTSDIIGYKVCAAVITERGTISSHAADILRSMGRPTVVGITYQSTAVVDWTSSTLHGCDGSSLRTGAIITVDGSTGRIFSGALVPGPKVFDRDIMKILNWADKFKQISIYANISNPLELIGVNRFHVDGALVLNFVQTLTSSDRSQTIAKSGKELDACPHEQELISQVLRSMRNRPTIIQLFRSNICSKPRLACGLTQLDNSTEMVSTNEIPIESIRSILKIVFGAVRQASIEGINLTPWILIPYMEPFSEFENLLSIVRATIEKTSKSIGCEADFKIGCLIDCPTACMKGREISTISDLEFIIFDTHRLTEMIFGYSKEDSLKIRLAYRDLRFFRSSPFYNLDIASVGKLIETSIFEVRKSRRDIKVGVRGSHCSNADSIKYMISIGMDYLCVDVADIPAAKIAAGKANVVEYARPQMPSEHTKRGQALEVFLRGLP